jgi:hypothetical protein
MLLHEPIETWPKCDCLIGFYATGYPLEKAQDYSKMHRPFVINDLWQQQVLRDRRDVYVVSLFFVASLARGVIEEQSTHTPALHPSGGM